jgi:hypothetical protein
MVQLLAYVCSRRFVSFVGETVRRHANGTRIDNHRESKRSKSAASLMTTKRQKKEAGPRLQRKRGIKVVHPSVDENRIDELIE